MENLIMLECLDFIDLVYEIKAAANQEIASAFLSQLQQLDLSLDEFLDGLAVHLSNSNADKAAFHLEEAARILRHQQSFNNK